MDMPLFEEQTQTHLDNAKPLASRMRPRTLDEFVGQQHFVGEGKLLRRLLKANRLGSVIFYGPPGTGKTTLAGLLAAHTNSHFRELSAVTSGVRDVREVLEEAQNRVAMSGQRTLLFVDEIHRFNKSQQEALLHDVENGVVILVGVTTSNPFFAVSSALISRSRVFQFEPLSVEDIKQLLLRAVADPERGFGNEEITVNDDAIEFLAEVSDGDARSALSALEIGILSSEERPLTFTIELARESVQRKAVLFDRDGDMHYDTASALIKSIRGSDPDAALYWLARMLEGGEDVRFMARRIVISASEDIGNADPHALSVAVAAMQASEFVGLPECQIPLAQAVTYLACAPKSNASYVGIQEARHDVEAGRVLPIPIHLRDKHYAGADRLGHGEGYEYSHNSADGVSEQDYLGVDRTYYRPVPRGFEVELSERLERIRAKLRKAKQSQEGATDEHG
jgi:putative ATPase